MTIAPDDDILHPVELWVAGFGRFVSRGLEMRLNSQRRRDAVFGENCPGVRVGRRIRDSRSGSDDRGIIGVESLSPQGLAFVVIHIVFDAWLGPTVPVRALLRRVSQLTGLTSVDIS